MKIKLKKKKLDYHTKGPIRGKMNQKWWQRTVCCPFLELRVFMHNGPWHSPGATSSSHYNVCLLHFCTHVIYEKNGCLLLLCDIICVKLFYLCEHYNEETFKPQTLWQNFFFCNCWNFIKQSILKKVWNKILVILYLRN